jgi:hypothetical protein
LKISRGLPRLQADPSQEGKGVYGKETIARLSRASIIKFVSDRYFEWLRGGCVGVVSVRMGLFAGSIDS